MGIITKIIMLKPEHNYEEAKETGVNIVVINREFTRLKLKIDRLTFILLIFLNNCNGVLLKPLQI